MQGFMIAFVLATLVEGLIEYFVSSPGQKQPWLKYISAVLGIGLCVAYKVDVLESLGLVSSYAFVGEIVSGLVVGRGSNYLNDFLERVRNPIPAVFVESPSTIKSETTTIKNG